MQEPRHAPETTILISSHDLAEIESFATHIGYLDRGRLQFSQSLAALSERFREIEVTVDARPALPADWPGHWLNPESSASVVRFIDSKYDADWTIGEVRRMFGGAARVAAHPMSLRSIFVALARQSRKAA